MDLIQTSNYSDKAKRQSPPPPLSSINTNSHHIDLLLFTEQDGEEEGGDDTASHGVVGVDQSTIFGITIGQNGIEARPEKPQKNSTWMKETRKIMHHSIWG